ncbi:MAG: L-threonylcarbamoyladenylate synthase [Patescibacteria group bacterium]
MKTTKSASKKDLRLPSVQGVNEVVLGCIKEGGVGVFPTDTIYGIVGSAFQKKAVQRIYRLKRRERKKPFIILISSVSEIRRFGIHLSAKKERFLRSLWPAKVSVRITCPARKFRYLHRGLSSLVFRLPPKKMLREILKKTGPLVAPSANVSGMPPAKNVWEARRYFGSSVDFYVDGGTIVGKPSTVIGFGVGGAIIVLRKGAGRIPQMI